MNCRLRRSIFLLTGFVAGVVITFGFQNQIERYNLAYAQEKSPATNTIISGATVPVYARESPPYRGLDANLYMQTSAEYRACCFQAYNWASRLLNERLATRQASSKPAAVVFDLDETVVDNRVYQTQQTRSGLAFDMRLWTDWELNGSEKLEAIPGAIDFITQLKVRNVERVYITNRNEHAHAQTMSALKRLGIEVPDDQLLCASEATGSNKTTRRAAIAEKFEVLFFVGDNLRDFDEQFRYDADQGVEGRKSVVDSHGERFGKDWVILPNPAYGEWMKPLGHGLADANLLSPLQ